MVALPAVAEIILWRSQAILRGTPQPRVTANLTAFHHVQMISLCPPSPKIYRGLRFFLPKDLALTWPVSISSSFFSFGRCSHRPEQMMGKGTITTFLGCSPLETSLSAGCLDARSCAIRSVFVPLIQGLLVTSSLVARAGSVHSNAAQ